jgi:hypothetical protein
MENNNKLIIFQGKNIRREWYNGEWYFSVIDIIEYLTESPNPRKYWSVLKTREPQLATICSQLKLESKDGKKYATDCATTEGMFRILMSVPSPKVEPLKQWLASLGKRELDELENPELGIARLREVYQLKGYPEEWIERRLQTIMVRKELTNEWKQRGVKEGQEYSILTAVIAKGTFGLTPTEHKELKGLEKENLRDHMTSMELILTALSEESTRMIIVNEDAQGFEENHDAAVKGGEVGNTARLAVEKKTGQKVVSGKNFKQLDGGDKENE